MSLRAPFVEALPEELQREAGALADVEARLQAIVADARARWPRVHADETGFARHLAGALAPEEPLARALDRLCGAELYLAYACATRNDAALTLFYAEQVPVLRAAIAGIAESAVEDVLPHVLEKLLVGRDESAPALLKYSGSGPLAAWLHVVAVRETHSALRRIQPILSDEVGALLDRAVGPADGELERIKQLYRARFKEAFQQAFESLSARDRNILRYELLDGLGVDEIAALHGVHRATMTRWRSRCRGVLMRETRRIFAGQENMSKRELESVVRLIQSQLDVSLPRLLRPRE